MNKEKERVTVTTRNLDSFLGVKRFRYGVVEERNNFV